MKHGKIATAAAFAATALLALAATALFPAAAAPGPYGASALAAQVTGMQTAAGQDHGLVGAALRMRQLDGVKRVLMIAAHPDDEDTSLLAALARGMGAETAYLSLSRGEGGQNLIGPRLHEGLGVIRTGELLAARALDGGGQYFTRAFDFGFSKNIDEAFRFWPLDDVLRDVVFVVRKFRPHVIVSVFSGTPRDGHGQHQVAGVAAREAFAAAGDPDRYPELAARGVTPWQPAKLYRSTRFTPRDVTIRVPTGVFDPVLGRSHFQLAMDSRSQHRSQDMGSGQSMGPRVSPLKLEAVAVGGVEGAEDDAIFAGVDTTLIGQLGTPLPAGWPADTERRLDLYRGAVADAADGLSATRPDGAVAGLARAAELLGGLVDEAPAGEGRRVLARRLLQVTEALLAAAGVIADVRVARDVLTPGESVVVDVHVWNGGLFELSGVAPELLLPTGWTASPTDETAAGPPRSPFFRPPVAETPADGRIAPGGIGRWSWRVAVPPDAAVSAPWYLREERAGGMYRWPDDEALWARPFAPAPVRARVAMALARTGTTMTVERDGRYVGVDQATGEYQERVLVLPAVNVAVDPPSMVWPAGAAGAREVSVVLTNTSTTARSGFVRLVAPDGWTVEPGSAPYTLEPDGASGSYTFTVTLGQDIYNGEFVLKAIAREREGSVRIGREINMDRFAIDFVTEVDIIDHPHIPRAALVRRSEVSVSVFPVAADTDLRVGYVMGSGDAGPDALRQIGMTVEELGEADLRRADFSRFDVLVLGVRAYETRPDLVAANEAVLAFARAGGTVIAQYNRYEFSGAGLAPYPVTIHRPHDRVTDENASVTILAPRSPVFAGPNAIGPADFEGWVQERGLYFLGEWDDRYTPVMEMADPGEDPRRGSLLVAEVGEGLYVYTGLAFFRQFPAGVPGAYRLFANVVSLRAEDWRRARPVS